MFLADVKMGMFDGIVYPVMDVEGGNILIANPGRTHVCLVCDGGDDGGDILGVSAHRVQKAEGHESSALGVIDAVYHISDIVKIAGDTGQFGLLAAVSKFQQNTAGVLCDPGDMGKTVLREAQGDQGLVRFSDILIDPLVLFDFFICDVHSQYSFVSIVLLCTAYVKNRCRFC